MSLPDWSNGDGAIRQRFAKICTVAAAVTGARDRAALKKRPPAPKRNVSKSRSKAKGKPHVRQNAVPPGRAGSARRR